MVPAWVLREEGMRGQAVRIAVYVGIRLLAFENPDREWESEREIANDIGEAIGVPAETCRKHLRVMRQIGVIAGDCELHMPGENPSGALQPQSGALQPHVPLTKKEDIKDLPQPSAEDADFDAFWALYPRRVGKKTARTAYTKARKVSSAREITEGLKARVDWWDRSGWGLKHISYPAKWLNGECWKDEIEPVEEKPTTKMQNPAILAVTDEFMALVKPWLEYRWPVMDNSVRIAIQTALAQGYEFGELAVRLAIQFRIDRRQLAMPGTANFVLCNVANVSRFKGGVPDIFGLEKTYEALMDRAYSIGKWQLR